MILSRQKCSFFLFCSVCLAAISPAQSDKSANPEAPSGKTDSVRLPPGLAVADAVSLKRSIKDADTGVARGAVFEGKGEVSFDLPKESKGKGSDQTYYSFHYKPAIAADGSYATVDLGGALIGARRSETMPGVCELVVLPGGKEGKKGSEWQRTGVLLPFDSAETVPVSVELVARIDEKAKTWDLYANRRLVASGLPYAKKSGKVVVKSSAQSETSLDSLRVTDFNPWSE